MKTRNSTLLPRVLEAVVGLFLIAAVCGMDRCRTVALPQSGSGGEIFGLKASDGLKTEWITSVVGQVGKSSGGQDAALWRSDGQGGYPLTVLPTLGGLDTAARWVDAYTETGLDVIGGESQTPGGVTKPVAWVELLPGVFSLHVLPTLGGPAGRSSAGERSPLHSDIWIVGTTQRSDGTFHATAWHVVQGSAITLDLDGLAARGGGNSEVRGIVQDHSPQGSVVTCVGRSQGPSGAWHATVWRSMDNGETWTFNDVHPGGASSVLSFIQGDTATHEVIAGGSAVTQNGRTVAGLLDPVFNGGRGWSALLAPGFRNTDATGLFLDRYGSRTIGSAWDLKSAAIPMIWNTIGSLGQTRGYRFELALDADSGFVNLGLNDVSAAGIVGHGFLPFLAGQMQPLVFAADGTQLPDAVDVLLGNPEANFRETDLWRSGDGAALRVASKNSQGDSAAVLTRTFVSKAREAASLDLKCVVRPIGANAMAQMNMQFYNFQTQSWESAGALQTLLGWTSAIGSIPFVGGVDALTGEVRVRLVCTRISGNVRGYEFDAATLTMVP